MNVIVTRTPAGSAALDPPTLAPLGIYALGALLRLSNHEVRIIDPYVVVTQLEFAEHLVDAARTADVVALSANSYNWASTHQTVRLLKRAYPELKVVIGGIHPTYFPEHCLRLARADAVVVGEGEDALPQMLDAMQRGEAIDGIPGVLTPDSPDPARLQRQLLDLEGRSPITPAYEDVPAGIYDGLCVETSRGCMANCCFCSVASRRNWRSFDVDGAVRSLLASMRHVDKTSKQFLYLVDDCFTASPTRAKEIMAKVTAATTQAFSLGVEARINNLLHDGLVDSLARMNMGLIQTGVECGYDDGIKRIGKGTSLDRVMRAAESLSKAGLAGPSMFSFIIGFPWETRMECLRTIHFAASLIEKYGIRVNLTWYSLIPSWIWENRAQWNIPFDESVFDNDLWFLVDDYWWSMHPSMSPNDFRAIEDVISTYADMHIQVRRGSEFRLLNADDQRMICITPS